MNIETSVFGADFFVMKIGIETLRVLQYKLRMMGVPILGLVFDLWGQHVSYSKHTAARSHIEEEVGFNLLPCN